MNATNSQIHSTDFLYSVNLWQNLLSVASFEEFLQLKTKKAMHFSYVGNSFRIQVGGL